MSNSAIRRAVGATMILSLALALPTFASPGSGGSNNGPNPPRKSDCRSPGKDLAPVRTGSVTGGQINIEGAGRVRLRGSFMTWGTVRGMTIHIRDRGGDGMVRVNGTCVQLGGPNGKRGTTLRSPSGRFLVDGTDVSVEIRGRGSLTIAVTGSGTGELNGVGTFSVNNGTAKSWPLKPIDLALAPTN